MNILTNLKTYRLATILTIIVISASALIALLLTVSPKNPSVIINDMEKQATELHKKNQSDATDSAADATTSANRNTATTTTNLPSAKSIDGLSVMAWIYPGEPGCSAKDELSDGRRIHTVKAEYFTINGGTLRRIDAAMYCNGYSAANIAKLKQHSVYQYVTVSSAIGADMAMFLADRAKFDSAVTTLTAFVVDNGLTGVELNFEDFGSWSNTSYADFKRFISVLGASLNAKGKRLMIVGPAVADVTEQAWHKWQYADFKTLPISQMVVMTYDYQFNHGAGTPIAPLDWMRRVILFISTQYPKERLVVGIPSYGYGGTLGTYRPAILTAEQIRTKNGYSTSTRHPGSQEMTWQQGDTVYFYQDSTSMKAKAAVAKELGISAISIWHLGGNNPWFY